MMETFKRTECRTVTAIKARLIIFLKGTFQLALWIGSMDTSFRESLKVTRIIGQEMSLTETNAPPHHNQQWADRRTDGRRGCVYSMHLFAGLLLYIS